MRVAHGFRDAAGQVGFDIVYNNGVAFEFDSTHSQMLGTNILDASRAYDAKGDTKLEVLYTVSGSTGNLFEYTNTGASMIAQNVRFATTYVDTSGALGLAIGYFDAGHGAIKAYTIDSKGTTTLYDGSSGGDPVTDYDQSSPGSGRGSCRRDDHHSDLRLRRLLPVWPGSERPGCRQRQHRDSLTLAGRMVPPVMSRNSAAAPAAAVGPIHSVPSPPWPRVSFR